jgi:ribokinase
MRRQAGSVEVTGFDVIVCGSLHLDIVVAAPLLPRVDETAVGTSWKKVCGGKGGNQAMQAARAGARTAMIGRVGRDEFGAALLENLTQSAVDVSGVSEDAATGSGMSVAILQDNGEYGAVIVSGANLTLDSQLLSASWAQLGGARVLILQNEVPHAVNVEAARLARADHAKVVFNAAPARPADQLLLENIDVMIVNRVEAEAMSGLPVHDRCSALAGAHVMKSETLSVVVTLGGDGLVVVESNGNSFEIDPIPVHITSAHGAGDCFVGTLAAQLSAGKSLKQACEAANMAAAAHVSRKE